MLRKLNRTATNRNLNGDRRRHSLNRIKKNFYANVGLAFSFRGGGSSEVAPLQLSLSSLLVIKDWPPCNFADLLVRDTISECLLDFSLKSQTPVEALWILRSIDLRVIALHPSFVNSRMPQNALLIPWISEPIRVNVFSFVIHKRGNSQYPEQLPTRTP